MGHLLSRYIHQPYREYILVLVLLMSLVYYYLLGGDEIFVLGAALLGSIVPLMRAAASVMEKRITIEAFNFFALAVSFATQEYTSAAFIALMLTSASWLDWRTESRASDAVTELLKLKPTRAIRETSGSQEEIDAAAIVVGDIVIVREGGHIPCDGVVVFGRAFVNEASLTGESVPVEKVLDSEVYSSTTSVSGIIKIRATRVGKDSTLERMARLIADASKHKSKAERLADRFAGIFLPVVVVAGVILYVVTQDIKMTAALFLIVCADDIAISIPLAITASIGVAAKRGVIIKGGEWLNALSRVDTIALDKTGTLTYGSFELVDVRIAQGVDEDLFWKLVAAGERLSEHPAGRALHAVALQKAGGSVPDPESVDVIRGSGIVAQIGRHRVGIGNRALAEHLNIRIPRDVDSLLQSDLARAHTEVVVFIDESFAGVLGIADKPKEEALEAIAHLKDLGVTPLMLTGDNEAVARSVSQALGIDEYRSKMTPESKLKMIDELSATRRLAMVGDGINDAPALARADVGIAMGGAGTAVAVEAASIVILTDRIDRLPEMIALSRRTVSVVNGDMAIWAITNALGVALVFMGIATPAFAALYNFLTDFLPIMNSARLFRPVSSKK